MYIEKKEVLFVVNFPLRSHPFVQNRHGNVQIVKILIVFLFFYKKIDAFGDG